MGSVITYVRKTLQCSFDSPLLGSLLVSSFMLTMMSVLTTTDSPFLKANNNDCSVTLNIIKVEVYVKL